MHGLRNNSWHTINGLSEFLQRNMREGHILSCGNECVLFRERDSFLVTITAGERATAKAREKEKLFILLRAACFLDIWNQDLMFTLNRSGDRFHFTPTLEQ